MAKISRFRCGEERRRGQGIRIGAVRYLPRGVKKEDYVRLDYFDVWFPVVAPTKELIKAFKEKSGGGEKTKEIFSWFKREYLKELSGNAEARQSIKLLAEFAKKTPLSVGCYCTEEALCHRSVLAEEIERAIGCDG